MIVMTAGALLIAGGVAMVWAANRRLLRRNRELFPRDAVLQMRRARRPGIFGFFTRRSIERLNLERWRNARPEWMRADAVSRNCIRLQHAGLLMVVVGFFAVVLGAAR